MEDGVSISSTTGWWSDLAPPTKRLGSGSIPTIWNKYSLKHYDRASDIKGKKGSFPAHRCMHMQCNIQKTIMRMCGLRCCALRKPGMRYVCAGCKGKEKRRGKANCNLKKRSHTRIIGHGRRERGGGRWEQHGAPSWSLDRGRPGGFADWTRFPRAILACVSSHVSAVRVNTE